MGEQTQMRVEHVLLMGSIVVACPVLSADPKPTSENTAKAAREAQEKSRPATAGQIASDEMPNRPNRKPRVHRTFPPPTRPL
jgi:hypothetical protein